MCYLAVSSVASICYVFAEVQLSSMQKLTAIGLQDGVLEISVEMRYL